MMYAPTARARRDIPKYRVTSIRVVAPTPHSPPSPPLFPRPHFIPTTSLWQPPQLPPLHHPPPSRHRIRQALSTLDVASALYDCRRWRHNRGRWRSHTSVGHGDGGAARGGGCCRTGDDTAVAPALQKGRRSSAGVRSGRCTAVPLPTGGGRCRRQGGGGGSRAGGREARTLLVHQPHLAKCRRTAVRVAQPPGLWERPAGRWTSRDREGPCC